MNITELKAEIKRLEYAEYAAQREQEKAFSAIYAEPSNWEYKSEPMTRKSYTDKTPISGCYVCKRLKPEVLDAWKQNGPSQYSGDAKDGQWLGMFYFRTEENILHYNEGGTLVFKTPMLCTDDEWQAILTGQIPAKFLR